MDRCIVYMTAGTWEEALAIGRALVEERLAACVNVLGTISSIYLWDGKVQEDGEVAFLAKTRRERVPDLTRRVKELHSYDTPCVVALPLADGSDDFLSWIDQVTTTS